MSPTLDVVLGSQIDHCVKVLEQERTELFVLALFLCLSDLGIARFR